MIRISVNMAHPELVGKDPKKVRLILSPLAGNFFVPRVHPPLARLPANQGDVGTSVPRWLEVGGSTPIYIEDADFVFMGNADEPFMGMRNTATLVDFMRKNLIIIEKNGVTLTVEQVINYSV